MTQITRIASQSGTPKGEDLFPASGLIAAPLNMWETPEQTLSAPSLEPSWYVAPPRGDNEEEEEDWDDDYDDDDEEEEEDWDEEDEDEDDYDEDEDEDDEDEDIDEDDEEED